MACQLDTHPGHKETYGLGPEKAQTQKQGNTCSTKKETKEDTQLKAAADKATERKTQGDTTASRGDSTTGRGRTSCDAATSHAGLLSQRWDQRCGGTCHPRKGHGATPCRGGVRHLEPRRTPHQRRTRRDPGVPRSTKPGEPADPPCRPRGATGSETGLGMRFLRIATRTSRTDPARRVLAAGTGARKVEWGPLLHKLKLQV